MFEKRFSLLSITGALAVLGASVPGASADDGPASTDEGGWFVEVGAGAAFRFGDSSTKSGGGNMVGVVSDVEFDPAVTVGGGVGYQFSAPLGVFLSYDYIGGDVSWLTTFAPTNITAFNGSAHSHIILANVRYSKEVFESTRISALLGAGGSINQLQDVAESCVIPCPPGQFIADVEDGDQASFAGSQTTGEMKANLALLKELFHSLK